MEGMAIAKNLNMSLEKIVNTDNQTILLHKRELRDYLEKGKSGLISIEVDLTLACNHRCPNCTFGDFKDMAVALSDTILDKIIEEAPRIGFKGMIISGGGEPSLDKRLGRFVRDVSRTGIDVTLTTNGQFIDRHFEGLMHNLKRMRLSIDSASYETFRQTHGIEKDAFDKIIDNLKKAVRYKKEKRLPIDIGVSFLICDENIHEINQAIDFYKKIGVNFLHFKPMQLWDKRTKAYYHKGYSLSEDLLAKLKTYAGDNFRISISRENYYKGYDSKLSYSKCHGAHFDIILGADARLYTCCHFKYNPKYCYGDLRKESLSGVLGRVKSDITRDCFSNCKMDALNQFLEFAGHHRDEVLNMSREMHPKDLPLGSKWL